MGSCVLSIGRGISDPLAICVQSAFRSASGKGTIVGMDDQDWSKRFPAATVSRCCNAEALLVLSRPGGFISKNCIHCKKSGYAHPSDLPTADCCGHAWPVVLIEKNYHYRCEVCQTTIAVGDFAPKWWELFPYSPLPAPGDPGWGDV